MFLKKLRIDTLKDWYKIKKTSNNPGSVQACVHFNKGFCRIDNDHVSAGIPYQYCCSYCLKEMGKKFDHPLSKCLRNKSNQGVNKTDNVAHNKKDYGLPLSRGKSCIN